MRDPRTLGTGTSLVWPPLVTVMTCRRCRAWLPPEIWMVCSGGTVVGFQWGGLVVRGEDVDGLVVLGSDETMEMFAVHGWLWLEAEFAHCGDCCAQCCGGREEVTEDVDISVSYTHLTLPTNREV